MRACSFPCSAGRCPASCWPACLPRACPIPPCAWSWRGPCWSLRSGCSVPDRPGKGGQPRAWQRMLSGRRLDLLEPSPLDIEIEDIAHGLARVARWNGQTRGSHAFSVAQHSVLVERLVSELSPRLTREARLMALLHDSPEYVVGDLISPFKAAVGLNYKALEERLQIAIHLRFGLRAEIPATLKALFKRADHLS